MEKRHVEKIKKLLNLARKTNSAGEAGNALSMARKLMEKYGVKQSDVDFIDITEASTKGAPSNAAQPPQYLAWLAQTVGLAFGVNWLLDWRYSGFTARRVVTFYGPGERPQIAAYAFDVLSRQLGKGRREYMATLHRNLKPINRTARADTWCTAWVEGAYQVITDFAVTDAEKTLMEAYQQKLRDNGMKSGDARAARTVKGADSAYSDGFSAGRQVRLNQAVGSQQPERQLIGGEHVC